MVIWARQAVVDLRSIHDFIARDSRYYAKKVVHDIREIVDELNGLPKMGRIVPELNEEDVRELFLYSYRIIYEIKDEVIFVLAVVHQRRNLKDENIPRES
ncbi:type II toxin-antitoxin system RelE/ParE family toxin [Nitrosomonas sp.]|uniref:type II toxin-antitoxin system RelE/ParE family toxin n=1 Tax=Nitrosomonas sp. TaxID=42353 RepID=UPI00272FA4DC|nr:type II toxin-antitoxin system RelE/ParE family toxin [Nitrosomonas sp.]MDP2223848.1 type II toxin-antitoxin system RelE/ParE family toxin [Nitrosomonas sp.]